MSSSPRIVIKRLLSPDGEFAADLIRRDTGELQFVVILIRGDDEAVLHRSGLYSDLEDAERDALAQMEWEAET